MDGASASESGTALVVSLGVIAVSWPIFQWLRYFFLVEEPPGIRRLRKREHVSFQRASQAVSKARPEHLQQEVFHQLLRAMWRGDFERADGTSRLTIEVAPGYRHVRGGGIPLEDPRIGDIDSNRDIDPDPERLPFSRRMLLSTIEMGIHNYYQSLDELRPALLDNEHTWGSLREMVNWELLASIPRDDYSYDYRDAYLKPLLMTGKDFRRWYRKFQAGEYEQ